jgi:hypothetical protein
MAELQLLRLDLSSQTLESDHCACLSLTPDDVTFRQTHCVVFWADAIIEPVHFIVPTMFIHFSGQPTTSKPLPCSPHRPQPDSKKSYVTLILCRKDKAYLLHNTEPTPNPAKCIPYAGSTTISVWSFVHSIGLSPGFNFGLIRTCSPYTSLFSSRFWQFHIVDPTHRSRCWASLCHL